MKTKLILGLYFASIGAMFAQTTPSLEWRRVTSPWRNHPAPFYPDGTTKPVIEDNRNSGDDWWYDHTKSFSGGIQDGVVCAGYYSWKNQGHDEVGNGLFYSDLSDLSYNVEDFEDCDNRKGTMWASIMKFDNEGRNGFCRSYYTNEYNSIISVANESGFIAVGATTSTLHPSNDHMVYGNSSTNVSPETPINYNPTLGNPGNHFAHNNVYTTPEKKNRKLKGLVTKVDSAGNILWSNLYGPRDYNQGGHSYGNATLTDRSHIWNVAEDPTNGNIWVVGTERDLIHGNWTVPPHGFDNFVDYSHSRRRLNAVQASTTTNCENQWKPFLMCLNSDGYVLAKDNIDTDGKYGVGEALGVAIKNGKVYVSGAYNYGCNNLGDYPGNDVLKSSPYVICYSTNWQTGNNPFSLVWAKFQDDFAAGETRGRTTSILVNDDGNVVLPVIHSGTGSNAAGPTASHVQGYGKIYMFNGVNGNPVTTLGGSSYDKVYLNEDIEAYDLKFDVIQTEDEGYAITSSVTGTPYSSITNINEISPLLTQNNCLDEDGHNQYTHYNANLSAATWFWDTDAYVAKYNKHFQLDWDKRVEYGGSTREAFPGNAKRQECVYSITENQNGSFTISGNTSDNFDDCYLFNLDVPCQAKPDVYFDFAGMYNYYDIISSSSHVNGQQVWNLSGNQKINGLIVVEPFTTLNIQDAELQFSDRKFNDKLTGIYVHANAKLIINNSTITGLEDSECPKALWDGIYVEGRNNDNQYDYEIEYGLKYYAQGEAVITNSTIKNARQAALNNYGVRYDSDLKIKWGYAGGIIQVSNTDFINNRRSAAFIQYQNTKLVNGVLENRKDKSFFYRCNFKTDNEYSTLYPTILQTQVTQWGVDGVDFSGCTFKNEDASNLLPNEKGSGITSVDATYSVKGSTIGNTNPPQILRGEFNGYINGIRVQNSSASFTNTISHQDFKNNKLDLALEFVNGPEVSNNRFIQEAKTTHKSILLRATGNYNIRNNLFVSDLDVNTLNPPNSNPYPFPYSYHSESDYGIIVDNFGFRNLGSIKDNTFNGYTFATMFTNGTSKGTTALLRCNKFGLEQSNAFAIVLDGADGTTPGGYINKDHSYLNGSGITVPVANTFSHFNPNWQIYSDIFNLNIAPDSYIDYLSLNNPAHIPELGLYTNSNVNVGVVSIDERACECGLDNRDSKYDVNEEKRMELVLTKKYDSWLTLNSNIAKLRDGGDKEWLIQEIQNPINQSAELRNELVSESPYLSDDVLVEAINRSIPLNDLHLAEVLVANLPLSREVKAAFTKNPPFGNPLASIVLTPEGNGVRQLLELQEKNAGAELDEALQFSLKQSVEQDLDYVVSDVWNYMNKIDVNNRYVQQRVDWLVDNGNFSEANALADSEKENSEAYLAWIGFNQDLRGRNHLQLETQELDKLNTWSTSDNSYLKMKSEALLGLQDITSFNDDVYLLNGVMPENKPKMKQIELEESHWISVSENPVKNEFQLLTDETEEELTFSIVDIKGITIKSGQLSNGFEKLDSSKWAPGIYIITVTHPTLGRDVIKIVKK